MATRTLLLLVIACCLSHYCKVEGDDRMKLSREEELEIEKQLKLLNKPAVKTIKTETGDVYDCIDFYKQPAFDHPLLKNHSYHFQMRPFYRPKLNDEKEHSMDGRIPLEIGLKGKGCPIGTVPIRRTTKEDLIRAKLFTDTTERPGLHHAVLRTRSYPMKKYNGGGAMITVYQPTVSNSQYSSGQMTLKNGPDSIQVGWTVNPLLYGDNQTRLFTFFKGSTTSCFNTQCPGFIIVNTEVPLDGIFGLISKRGGPIYTCSFFIYRDKFSGNWWLEIGPNYTQVGFWPQRIFSGLRDLATYVEWGGEAYGPPGQQGPEMGSAHLPVGDTDLDAFCKLITTVNEAHEPVDADNTERFSDNKFYGVDDWGYRGSHFGHLSGFGGPGPI